jgi:hypothetical protein
MVFSWIASGTLVSKVLARREDAATVPIFECPLSLFDFGRGRGKDTLGQRLQLLA